MPTPRGLSKASICRIIGITVVAHKPTNARCTGACMHDTQKMAVLVMCALEFEYQLAPVCGYSDSSSTYVHKRACRQLYVLETLDSQHFLKRQMFAAVPMWLTPMCVPDLCINSCAFCQISPTISKVSIELFLIGSVCCIDSATTYHTSSSLSSDAPAHSVVHSQTQCNRS